jgi:hypothetical protein
MNYTDEEIRNILLKIYPEEQERIGNKTVDQLLLSIQEG